MLKKRKRQADGSHWNTTDSGIPFHIRCTKNFANDPKAMAMMKQVVEAAYNEPVNENRKIKNQQEK